VGRQCNSFDPVAVPFSSDPLSAYTVRSYFVRRQSPVFSEAVFYPRISLCPSPCSSSSTWGDAAGLFEAEAGLICQDRDANAQDDMWGKHETFLEERKLVRILKGQQR